MAVRKTTLTIDDDVLADAREILGTSGIKDTIDAALHEVRVAAARERDIERMRTMDGIDPEKMLDAWPRRNRLGDFGGQ